MKLVIKEGTSTLADSTGRLNVRRVKALCETLSDLKNAGHEIVLVSSGAIGMGVGKLGLNARPTDMPTKQAAAAVGQCELMYTYDKMFAEFGHTVAQLLLTGADFSHEDRLLNLKNTFGRLLELGALPIVNENDTVATEEIEFGDNDTLGAKVATAANADILILLSDIDGLYTKDPRSNQDAEFIPEVYELSDNVMALGGGAGTKHGTGGMETKLKAAKIATDAGCDMIIMNGAKLEQLYSIVDGERVGTRFYAKK